MADHSELVAELPLVEKMTTQERLKHAKKRRVQQLKQYSVKEKEFTSKRRKTSSSAQQLGNLLQGAGRKSSSGTNGNKSCRVHFDPSVMLLEAAARNDVDEVQRLLLLGVNPDSTNEDGLTALHQCCIDDSDKMMRLLLEFGANVNAEDSEKWTPLHAASTCGHLNLAKFLINKGANLLAVNADGNMPYDICEEEKTLDYIEAEMAKRGITQQLIDDTRASTEMQMLHDLKMLLDKDGDLDATDEQGATYLHAASANGYITVVEFLLDNGANPNVADNDTWSCCHAAACWGHPDILEMLALHGADLNALTKNGETPYDICEDPDMKDRIQELKTEIEFKQKTQQSTRLRRTQSQNTRSRSVRRTSIRDKSQISWKEARSEAKMRLEQQDKFLSQIGSQKTLDVVVQDQFVDTRVVNVEDITVVVPSTIKKVQPERLTDIYGVESNGHESKKVVEENNKELSKTSSKLEANLSKQDSKEGDNTNCDDKSASRNGSERKKRGTSTSGKKTDTDNLMNLVNCSNSGNSEGGNLPSEGGVTCATAVATSQSDLKLDLTVHVTVNTGTTTTQFNNSGMGTLSDLKKQRNDKRNRTSSIISTTTREPLKQDENKSNGGTNNKLAFQCPPSPLASRHKFSGNSNDVVGTGEKQGCCVVM